MVEAEAEVVVAMGPSVAVVEVMVEAEELIEAVQAEDEELLVVKYMCKWFHSTWIKASC